MPSKLAYRFVEAERFEVPEERVAAKEEPPHRPLTSAEFDALCKDSRRELSLLISDLDDAIRFNKAEATYLRAAEALSFDERVEQQRQKTLKWVIEAAETVLSQKTNSPCLPAHTLFPRPPPPTHLTRAHLHLSLPLLRSLLLPSVLSRLPPLPAGSQCSWPDFERHVLTPLVDECGMDEDAVEEMYDVAREVAKMKTPWRWEWRC
ncbi:hypothetical protein JCM6882_007084 [Rhodosporidiobolus microsporus]